MGDLSSYTLMEPSDTCTAQFNGACNAVSLVGGGGVAVRLGERQQQSAGGTERSGWRRNVRNYSTKCFVIVNTPWTNGIVNT